MNKSLYERLGCACTATQSEVRKAFLRCAKRAHPDRGGDAEEFALVKEAFDILSDVSLRKIYDARGIDAARDARARGVGGGVSGSRADASTAAATLFSALFGGSRSFSSFSFPSPGQQRRRRARTRVYRLRLSLEEIFLGTTVPVEIRVRRLKVVGSMVQWTTAIRDVDVKVERGAKAVLIEGVGDDSVDAASSMLEAATSGRATEVERRAAALRGDLRFDIAAQPHPIYTLDQNFDLHARISLKLSEALDSTHVAKLPGLGGAIIEVKLSGVTRAGHVAKVKGKGMCVKDPMSELETFGDLFVVVEEVQLPRTLDPEVERKVLRALRSKSSKM